VSSCKAFSGLECGTGSCKTSQPSTSTIDDSLRTCFGRPSRFPKLFHTADDSEPGGQDDMTLLFCRSFSEFTRVACRCRRGSTGSPNQGRTKTEQAEVSGAASARDRAPMNRGPGEMNDQIPGRCPLHRLDNAVSGLGGKFDERASLGGGRGSRDDVKGGL
jgi:hypothetical protein